MPGFTVTDQRGNAPVGDYNSYNPGAKSDATKKTELTGLAGFIRQKWEEAKRAKISSGVDGQMLKAIRARKGEYEPDKLQAIRQVFGADYKAVYMLLIDHKCRSAEAWIKDVLLKNQDEPPWDIKPTPIPELPEPIEKQVKTGVYQSVLQMLSAQAMQTGQAFSSEQAIQEYNEVLPTIMEKIDKEIYKKAKEAVERMKRKISDQFQEGGWPDAVKEAISDVVTLKAGIVKGPVQRVKRVPKIVYDESTGSFIPKVEKKIVSTYERRSPFNIYPAPDASDVNDGYLIDLVEFSADGLYDLMDVPGYKAEAIREVLTQHGAGGLHEWTMLESEKKRLEGKDSQAVAVSNTIDCVDYYGPARGDDLIDWGLTTLDGGEPIDALREYQINAYLIGAEVIRCIINPDPLGKKPFMKASYDEDPDSFWGRGVPDLLFDIQGIINSVARAIVNNAAIASGPIVEVNQDRLAPGETAQIWPWRIYEVTDDQMMRGGRAVNFYTPPFVSDKLMGLFEFFLGIADMVSGIPRYGQASGDTSGAAKTASGLSMIMTHDARGIKSVINNIDNGIIKPSVEKQYYFNLFYEYDIELIGDVQVIARGSSSLIAKEQQAVRRNEFLGMTANPYDINLLGPKVRGTLIKEALKALEIDTAAITEEIDFEIERKMKESLPQQMPLPGMGRRGQQPLNQAGEPVAGQDFALFQNNGGVRS